MYLKSPYSKFHSKIALVSLDSLTPLPLPSRLVPTPYTKGGGSAGRPAISKTIPPMNLKFCRVLEASFTVLEMLKLFAKCSLGYHSNSSKERCFIGKIARFQQKIPIFKLLPNSQS